LFRIGGALGELTWGSVRILLFSLLGWVAPASKAGEAAGAGKAIDVRPGP